MEVGLPVIFEKPSHSAVADFPQQLPILLNLFQGWLGHKKGARVRP